jgi:shikimate dehydrogenase
MPILSGKARVAGIAGWPVGYSRSPRVHAFWLRRYGIDGAYVPLPIRPGQFAVAVHGLAAAGFAGVNVTIPHKLKAFAICDELDDAARRVGAVNTLVFSDGRIKGSNTDTFGFVANLRDHQIDPAVGPALVLGAGGAARAVISSLTELGAQVTIANRSRARAEALAAQFPGSRIVPWHLRSQVLSDYSLVVNATPLGTSGHDTLELDLESAAPALVVADLVYTPLETALLRAARLHGLRAVDGLGMLLHQARPGFEAWFGVPPIVDEELRQFVAADLAGA